MQMCMKNSVFDSNFEFSNFTDLKQSHRQISLSYSYSAGNLAIENTRFKKSIRICPTLLIRVKLMSAVMWMLSAVAPSGAVRFMLPSLYTPPSNNINPSAKHTQWPVDIYCLSVCLSVCLRHNGIM